jgi:hypothetical protein
MAGRKPKLQEFLLTLQAVTKANNKQLASLLGKDHSNITDYLNGKKPIGLRALRSAVSHLSEWSAIPDKTMIAVEKKTSISTEPGIFFMYDSSGNCVYLGQAKNLKTEVSARLNTKKLRHGIWRDRNLKRKRYQMTEVVEYITTFKVVSPRLRHNLEALFLRTVINQTQNSKLGNFK